MNRLIKRLSKYVNKYLNTRFVFFIDMCLSLIASLLAVVLVNVLVPKADLVTFKSLSSWLGASAVFSFLFIWFLRAYRIIIRHTTLKDLAKFVFVALLKVLATGTVYGVMVGNTTSLYLVMVSDFFLTFAFFFVMKMLI